MAQIFLFTLTDMTERELEVSRILSGQMVISEDCCQIQMKVVWVHTMILHGEMQAPVQFGLNSMKVAIFLQSIDLMILTV